MAARIAVLASGDGTNLQAIIDFYSGDDMTAAGMIALVASNRHTAFALERARAKSVPSEVFDDSDDGEALLALLRRYAIEIVALAGYTRRVPSRVVGAFAGRMINVHPGPLPEFGGAGMYGERVHRAVLASGAKSSGVSVHLVDDEYDHGPVVAQWRIPVRDGDTPASLAARVLTAEHVVYPRVVDMVAALNALDFAAEL